MSLVDYLWVSDGGAKSIAKVKKFGDLKILVKIE
jgi:hypothetical protein